MGVCYHKGWARVKTVSRKMNLRGTSWHCLQCHQDLRLGLKHARGVLAGSDSSVALFPLTPALSLEEREPRTPSAEHS
jgi:hypothetical protein